jgi:metallophosphoesterase (TIGR00282 family)
VKILLIGDVIGEPGRRIVANNLQRLIQEARLDFVIVNGENAAGGFGITPKIAQEFFDMGADVVTTGNHVLDKKEITDYLDREKRLIRPANYPEGVPGYGKVLVETDRGEKVAVLQLMGRIFMLPIDCPFQTARRELKTLQEQTRTIIVDMHADATSEKMAMGWFLDGEVSAVLGTHTHVQTADERILPGGTAYITDVGMAGPVNSVIGIRKEDAIEKFLTQTPKRFEMASGPSVLSAVIVEIETPSGRARSIQRIQIHEKTTDATV